MAGLRKKEITVDCSNCGETYTVKFAGKIQVAYCSFCGEEVLIAEDERPSRPLSNFEEADQYDDDDEDEMEYWEDDDPDSDN